MLKKFSFLVHELVHSMKQEDDDGTNNMAVKLDMANAYDRVEWAFLNAMMRKLGFDDTFCWWIMKRVEMVTYSVMINGEDFAKGVPFHRFPF